MTSPSPISGRILSAISKPAPAPTSSEPEWTSIDTTTLSPELLALYNEYRRVSALATSARKAFETSLSSAIDPLPGERVIFGYRFGKLSLAIVPDVTKPKRASSALSLADFKAR